MASSEINSYPFGSRILAIFRLNSLEVLTVRCVFPTTFLTMFAYIFDNLYVGALMNDTIGLPGLTSLCVLICRYMGQIDVYDLKYSSFSSEMWSFLCHFENNVSTFLSIGAVGCLLSSWYVFLSFRCVIIFECCCLVSILPFRGLYLH